MTAEPTPQVYAGRWAAEQLLREIGAWCAVVRDRPQDCRSGAVPLGPGRWDEGVGPHLAVAPEEDKSLWREVVARAEEYRALVRALSFAVALLPALLAPLSGCDARRCQDTVRVLPSGGGIVCDPTATATVQRTDKGPTVVCTCPKAEPGTAPAETTPGETAPGETTPNTNDED